MKHLAPVLSVLISSALILVACGGAPPTPLPATAAPVITAAPGATQGAATVPPTSAKDTLIVGVTETSPGVDIDIQSHRESWRLGFNLYPKALIYEYVPSGLPANPDILWPNFNKLMPGFIQSWETSQDSLTTTFHMQKGITSYYGNAFTTKDILWTFDRAFANKAIQEFLWRVADVTKIDQVKIIDDYTFSLTTPAPNPMVVQMMANNYLAWFDSTEAKKHATTTDQWALEWIKKNGSCGLGPYVVTDWVSGDRIVLKANPNYHMGKPPIENITFKAIPESSNRMSLIKDGSIDIAYDLAYTELDALKTASGVRVLKLPNVFYLWGIMNNQMPPFDNKLVRQAMNYAVNRQEIAQTAYMGYGKPATSAIPSLYPAATSPQDFPYSYDPAKAKTLLQEAGFPNGFEVELSYAAEEPTHEAAATIIQKNLAEIGVKVNLRKMPGGELATLLGARKILFGLYDNAPAMADPNYAVMQGYLSTTQNDYNNYKNAEVDRLILEGKKVMDPQQRIDYHKNIQKIIMDDAAALFLVEKDFNVAIRDNVLGYSWDTLNEPVLDFLHFAK